MNMCYLAYPAAVSSIYNIEERATSGKADEIADSMPKVPLPWIITASYSGGSTCARSNSFCLSAAQVK